MENVTGPVNILFVCGDFKIHHSALKLALSLALNFSARLKVVEVLEELPQRLQIASGAAQTVNLREIIARERVEKLQEAVSSLGPEGADVSVKVLFGKPFVELICEVLRHKHDLVIMTSEEGSSFRNLLIGSTAMHMIRKCQCPVLVLRPGRKGHFGRILAAVDPAAPDDESKEERNTLNGKILRLASTMGRIKQADIHIIHAWTVYGETILRNRMSSKEWDAYRRETKMDRKRFLDELVARYAPAQANRIHLVKGDARRVIPRMVKRKKIDLLVLGSLARTGIAGLLIGNTAERILQDVGCSVLTVKPDRFVTPLECAER